jgi:hypothetical protein
MPIFDDIVPATHLWPVDARWPLRRATALIQRFHSVFRNLHYDLFWQTRLMNAQAFLMPEGRCVRLYGGLGRHRDIGVEGLAFALAHETGHHLGGPPRHQYYRSLSSEERANEWAAEIGLPTLFGKTLGNRYAQRGLLQLELLSSRYSIKSAIW